MGHRSSKLTAGQTDGNTSNNNKSNKKSDSNNSNSKDTSIAVTTTAKSNQHSTRRHSARFPKSRTSHNNNNNSASDKKNYRHSIAASTTSTSTTTLNNTSINSQQSTASASAYEDHNQFLPILQLESDTSSLAAAEGNSVVSNNTAGQIIIKIRFKTHPTTTSDMEDDENNMQQMSKTADHNNARAALTSSFDEATYRRLMDTNLNRMPQALRAGAASNVIDIETARGRAAAAGSTTLNATLWQNNHNNNNAYNNNDSNRTSLPPLHLNALRITEPLLEDADAASCVDYYEANEEEAASTATSRRQHQTTTDNSSHNCRSSMSNSGTNSSTSSSSSSRRQKAKSAFMNFRSKLEGAASSSNSSSKMQLNKVSNVNNNNNNSNSNCNRSEQEQQQQQSNCNNHSYSIPLQTMSSSSVSSAMAPKRAPLSGDTTPAAATTIAAASSIYHDTPLRNLTALATTTPIPTPTHPPAISITTSKANATLPPSTSSTSSPSVSVSTSGVTPTSATNPQLAIWTTNKDVIISSINLLVCPSTTSTTMGAGGGGGGGGVVTLERLMATELAAAASNIAVGSVGSTSIVDNAIVAQLKSSAACPVPTATAVGPIVHSQVDFVHYLVPDLERIFNSSFYWGKMDRYEAERLLEGKPEGTFLLRDSAQEEYLFSVTFRKYGRSLHARIEQNGHKFSFDCHDPAVFSTSTVTGLLEHYKDPGSVMFFEPMLTVPFHRKTVFSLQQLARAAIVSNTTYDGISELELPVRLKAYLKEYHYKQKLRVKLLDETLLTCT